MSADATSTNLKEWGQYEEYGKIASFFVSLTGSPEEANTLLQRVVDALPVSNYANSRKRSATSPAVPSASSSEHSFLVGDALDRTIITCLVQIPNDHAVIGAIIGPQGKHIKQMTESTGCLVNLDQKSQSAQSRTAPITVFLQGPLRAVIKVAERVSLKVESVTKESSNSSNWVGTGSGANRTIMIIPDLLVKRVIGRGGTSVTKLQRDSGAAIQLQNEAKMMTSPDPLFGREALITGSLPARLHGLYLICRMMLEDGDCPAAWKTAQLFPTPIRGLSGGGMVMTAKGVFGQGAPPPPSLNRGRGSNRGMPRSSSSISSSNSSRYSSSISSCSSSRHSSSSCSSSRHSSSSSSSSNSYNYSSSN